MLFGELEWRVTVGSNPSLLFNAPITEVSGMARDELRQLIGDGAARVGCGLTIKDGDYGNGFDAHVSVQLTCNQDRDSIRAATVLATELAQNGLADAFDAAHEEFKELGPHPVAKRTR